jgi:hypothetical protein
MRKLCGILGEQHSSQRAQQIQKNKYQNEWVKFEVETNMDNVDWTLEKGVREGTTEDRLTWEVAWSTVTCVVSKLSSKEEVGDITSVGAGEWQELTYVSCDHLTVV